MSAKITVALDTNVLLNITRKNPKVTPLLPLLRELGVKFFVYDTVLDELITIHDGHYQNPEMTAVEIEALKQTATETLESLALWGVEIARLESHHDDAVNLREEIATRLIKAACLPQTEKNDARIVAESAIARMHRIATGDGGMTLISEPGRSRAIDILREYSYTLPAIQTPRAMRDSLLMDPEAATIAQT